MEFDMRRQVFRATVSFKIGSIRVAACCPLVELLLSRVWRFKQALDVGLLRRVVKRGSGHDV